jgi:hypothetical protein
MTELLGCPFCGAAGAICSWENLSGFWVNCSCGVETPERRTEAEAIALWNTRVHAQGEAVTQPAGSAVYEQTRADVLERIVICELQREIASLRAQLASARKALEEIREFPYMGLQAARQIRLIAASALTDEKST